ncbi:MAG: hypothetical protein RSB67_02515 [Clostridia bacterium]
MKTKDKRYGISLIVLVITIIVIIILATAVIVTVVKNNPIQKASEANFKQTTDAFKDQLNLRIIENALDNNQSSEFLQASTEEEILKYIPIMKDKTVNGIKYTDLFEIQNGKLVIKDTSREDLNKWGEDINVISKKDLPLIPTGFKYIEGTKNTGVVISDNAGNEFVFVPIDNPGPDNDLNDMGNFRKLISDTKFVDNIADDINISNAIKRSVKKAKGFYISRYEIGIGGNATFNDKINQSETKLSLTNWENAFPVSKKGAKPWNFISREKSKEVAASMYTGNIKSYLVSSYAWDSTLRWLYKSGDKTLEQMEKDSSAWGNYLNSEIILNNADIYSKDGKTYSSAVNLSNLKKANEAIILSTGAGSNKKNMTNNIYDLAGNLKEWTTEDGSFENKIYAVRRTGCFGDLGNDFNKGYPASGRIGDNAWSLGIGVGFRTILYW